MGLFDKLGPEVQELVGLVVVEHVLQSVGVLMEGFVHGCEHGLYGLCVVRVRCGGARWVQGVKVPWGGIEKCVGVSGREV